MKLLLQSLPTEERLAASPASKSEISMSTETRGASDVVTTRPENGAISDGRRVLTVLVILFDTFLRFQWETRNSTPKIIMEAAMPKPKMRNAPETVSRVAVRDGELDPLFIGWQPYLAVYSLLQR